MMASRIIHTAKTLLQQASPRHIAGRQRTSKVIRRFVESLGLVYFGYVNQQDDEYRLMRGITVSNTHDDHYYSVGTFRGYDMALTVRRDTLKYPDKRLKDHFWTIMTFDLHTHYELPHCYVGHSTPREEFLVRYTDLTPVIVSSYSPHYGQKFLNEYTVHAKASQAQIIAMLFTPEMANTIAERFDGVSVELLDNTVYLYRPERHPTRAELERMTNNGLWLAETVDARLSVLN